MIHLLSTLYTCWFISTERNAFRTQQGINHNRRRPEKQNKLRRAGNSIALQFYKLNWEKWSWSTVQPVPSYSNFSFLVFRDVSECEPAREKEKEPKKKATIQTWGCEGLKYGEFNEPIKPEDFIALFGTYLNWRRSVQGDSFSLPPACLSILELRFAVVVFVT